MAVEAKYTAPLQVVETEQMRDRIKTIAEAEKISQAQVIREILFNGIEKREQDSRARVDVCNSETGYHSSPHKNCVLR